MEPVTIPRADFLESYWRYRLGEHVTILGPTGSGKTHLKWQLLQHTARREAPALVLATKPKDTTTARWAKALGFPVIREYPPLPSPRRMISRPPGRVLWPRHTFDPDRDDVNHTRIFRAALRDAYKRGRQIVDMDEMLDAADLGLDRDLRTLWTRGRSMGTGLWAGTQRPFAVPVAAYGQAEHLFVAYDPDRRSQDRYDEIGGMEPRLVRAWVSGLDRHEFLYLHRLGPEVCIVSA